jgi:hypothetical protein
MKNAKLFLFGAIAVFVLAFSLSISGCKSDETTEPEAVQPITEDLFPLVVGRQLVFSGHLTDRNGTQIPGTSTVYEARMTVTALNAPLPAPIGTSHVISDSQRVPTGVATPPTMWFVSNFYVQRTPATGTGNFRFLTNIANFYRTFGLQRADSLRWILLVRQDLGVGVEWTAFDSTWTAATGPVRLQVVGKVDGRESLTLGGQTFNAYKITATRKVYLGGATTPSVQAPTAELWMQPNVGIVKFIFYADGQSGGFYREYKSRNFQ